MGGHSYTTTISKGTKFTSDAAQMNSTLDSKILRQEEKSYSLRVSLVGKLIVNPVTRMAMYVPNPVPTRQCIPVYQIKPGFEYYRGKNARKPNAKCLPPSVAMDKEKVNSLFV